MSKLTTPKNSKSLSLFCAKLAAEKIAQNIIVLDLTTIETAPADYFVICSCDSEAQLNAVSDNIMRKSKVAKLDKPNIEGETGTDWVLLDYFDVVVHIMLREARDFYKIEKLWADAKFYNFNSKTSRLNKIEQSKVLDIINTNFENKFFN